VKLQFTIEKFMSVPDYQTLMLPVLKQAALGEARIGDVVETLAAEFQLSDSDLSELIPSGKQTTFSNRVHWAKSYLKQAGLVEATKRAHFAITPRGKDVLKSGIQRIDIKFLRQFSEFIEFQNRSSTEGTDNSIQPSQEAILTDDSQTPDDLMRKTSATIHTALGNDILDRLRVSKPAFFERVVVQLLLAMGYGGTLAQAGKAIGKSGDNGVDGVIDQDTLGLDRVYVQAKRYAEDVTVGAGDIRDFFGSLDMHKASKGLFVTTSSFTKAAMETAEKLGKRIVLIDGRDLTKLMIRFNVGCRVEEVFEMKKIDEEFFE
jgi:restriction system protein